MADQEAMDVDVPPSTAGPAAIASAVDSAATSTTAQTPAGAQAAASTSTSNVTGPTTGPASDFMEVDPTPSARTAELTTDVAAAPAGASTSNSVPSEESTTTVEKSTTIAEISNTTGNAATSIVVVQETTEIIQQTTSATPVPSILEQIVANGTTESSDSAHQALAIVHDPSSSSAPLDTPSRPASPQRIFRTGYVFDHLMMLHCQDGYTPTADSVLSDAGGHPEEPMRIKRIFSRLADQGLIKRMKRLNFSQVTMDQILLVHTEEHWNKVQGTESEPKLLWY